MAATKRLFIRVTKNQFERIRLNAQANGFVTISEYIRSMALEKDLSFQSKFNELYGKIMDKSGKVARIQERSLQAYLEIS